MDQDNKETIGHRVDRAKVLLDCISEFINFDEPLKAKPLATELELEVRWIRDLIRFEEEEGT